MKSVDVVFAVPDPQFLSGPQLATHPEVDVFAVLKGRQVPLALLRRGPHEPAGFQRCDVG